MLYLGTSICAGRAIALVTATGANTELGRIGKLVASAKVAMGMRGTEVAKEAADVVLADDNFSTILTAVEGGRTIYSNITKFIHLMLSKNLGVVLMIFAAIVVGLPLPLLPLQILWINLVTDVFPALALALEPAASGVMQRRPHSSNESLLGRPFLVLILGQGAMLAAIILAAYVWAVKEYGEGAQARTVALMALVGVQLGHMLNCRSRTRSAFSNLFRSPFIWAALLVVAGLQLLAVYLAPLARLLQTVPLTATDWMIVTAAIIATVIMIEVVKIFFRWRDV